MSLTHLQIENLKLDYKRIYSTIKLPIPHDNNDYVIDSVMGYKFNYYNSKQAQNIKKKRTIVQLCDNYRKDFPLDWQLYIHVLNNEHLKNKARTIFKDGVINGVKNVQNHIIGLDMFIKCLWGHNVSFENVLCVDTNISYPDFCNQFYSSIYRDFLVKKSVKDMFWETYKLTSDSLTLFNAFNYLQTNFVLLKDEDIRLGLHSKYLK